MRSRIVLAALLFSLTVVWAPAQETPRVQIADWPAPAVWTPPPSAGPARVSGERAPVAPQAAITSPLPFVAVAPCRMFDTRTTTPIASGSARGVVLTGAPCGIPSNAAAVSANLVVFNITGTSSNGVLTVFPTGSPATSMALINWSPTSGQIDNAAVVPLGTGGSITVQPNQGAGSIDMVIDVNGYYGGGVVTTLNALSGDVTLAAGSNLTITPSGQTLTLAATAGPGGVLPTGTSGQTLRHNGTAWVPNSALTSDGTDVFLNRDLTLNGTLHLETLRFMLGSFPFLHNCCSSNDLFLGDGAGNFTNAGGSNTGMGTFAFTHLTTGVANVAVGDNALADNTDGSFNTAVGSTALANNSSSSSNTAIGYDALQKATGGANTALGSIAGISITTGSNNIAIGFNAGTAITTGSNNIDIGNAGFNNESNTIRIGSNQTGAIIVGIAGETAPGGVPVLISGGGRLGTTTSSRRFKQDIREIGEESDGLMRLRPVVFKYRPEIDPSGLIQYGLVAEDVAEVYPDLVACGRDGLPEAIRYHLLVPMLLNEVQRDRKTIRDLKTRLERLEALTPESVR